MHELAHFTGISNLAGPWYGFWSGIGSDIGELAIFAAMFTAVIGAYRRVNCHQDGCPRIGRHPLVGTGLVLCKKHHPVINGPITAGHIEAAHKAAADAGLATHRRRLHDP